MNAKRIDRADCLIRTWEVIRRRAAFCRDEKITLRACKNLERLHAVRERFFLASVADRFVERLASV